MNASISVWTGDGVWSFVGSVLAQVSIIAALALVLGRVLAARDAAMRHAVGLVSLCCLLISPVVTAVVANNGWTYWRIPSVGLVAHDAPPAATVQQPARPPITTAERSSSTGSVQPADKHTDANSKPPIDLDSLDSRQNARPASGMASDVSRASDGVSGANAWKLGGKWAAWLWAVGSGLLLVRLVFGWTQLVGLRRRTRPLQGRLPDQVHQAVCAALGVDQLPTIVVSADISQPVAAGFLRPMVVLPQELADHLDDPRLCAVLIHECAHVVRHDHWVGLMQRVAELLYWPHPLVHLLNRSLSRAREETCDNYVLRGGDAPGYARILLELAQVRWRMPIAAAVTRLHDPRWRLEHRVAGLLDARRCLSTQVSRHLLVSLAVLFVPIAAAVAGIGVAQSEVAVAASPVATSAADASQPSAPVAASEAITGGGDATSSERKGEESPLPPGAIARLGSDRFRQPGGVSELTWSPDGRYLAANSSRVVASVASLRMWDAATGEAVHAWKMRDSFETLDFSPDGKRFASATWQRYINVWDVESGKLLSHLGAYDHDAYGVLMPSFARFTPDGKSLVYGGRGAVLQVFDIDSGRATLEIDMAKRLNAKLGDIEALALTPDGLAVAIATRDDKIRLWKLADEMPYLEIETGNVQRFGYRFSPDGRAIIWLETASRTRPRKPGIYVADVATGSQRLLIPQDPLDSYFAFDVAPDGKTIASGGWDRAVKFFDFESGKQKGAFRKLGSPISTVAYSPDGSRLAAGGESGVVLLWDLKSGQQIVHGDGHRGPVVAGRLIDGGRVALTGSEDGTIRRWDMQVGASTIVAELTKNSSPAIDGVAISPDGRLAAFSHRNSIYLINVATGGREELRGFRDKENEISGVTSNTAQMYFSEDGRRLASLTRTSTNAAPLVSIVRVWDTSNGSRLGEARVETRQFNIPDMGFSADGTRFVVVGTKHRPNASEFGSRNDEYEARLYDATSGDLVREYKDTKLFPNGVAFAPGGHLFATGRGDAVDFWDLASGEPSFVVQGNSNGGMLGSMVFSPDGKRVAAHITVSGDAPALTKSMIHVWDCESRKLTHELAADPLSLSFSADGNLLIACQEDQTTLVFDLNADSMSSKPTTD